MQLGKKGVSDFDLGKFNPAISNIEQSGYIPIDVKALKQFLRNQIISHAAPGGGHEFDFIIKQVNTNLNEFALICELMGSQPKKRFFLFREPSNWLPSAMKKFNITESEAVLIYQQSLDSFAQIGGKIVEYGPEIDIVLSQYNTNTFIPFSEKSTKEERITPNDLIFAYTDFKAKHALQ